MKYKSLFLKTILYRIFVSLPFIFFLTFLFFKNFIRSIEYTITVFFTSTFLLFGYECVYTLKPKWKRNTIIGVWFLGMIVGCVLLKKTMT